MHRRQHCTGIKLPPHLHDGVVVRSPAEQPRHKNTIYNIHKLRFSGLAEEPLQYFNDSEDGLDQQQDSEEETSREVDSGRTSIGT